MKNVSFTTIALILSTQLIAQSIISPSWIKTEESTTGVAEAWGVKVDEDKNIYWTTNTDHLNQGLDIKCYKFSSAGEELWENPLLYGGPGAQQAYIVNSDNNGLFIGGRFCTGLVNTCDMLLLKVDKNNGALVWDKTMNFSGNGYDEIDGLALMSDGIYCGGWAQEIQTGAFQSDIGFWKLDYSGNTIWTNHYGQANSAEHQDGHFVVDENHIYAAGLWNGTGLANLYNGHSFLGKFSKQDGSIIDSTLFGPQSNAFLDIENALGMTSDGEFLYITGYSTPVSVDDWQIFVAKYDKNLNQLWYTDWGGLGTESARGIAVDDGVIYVAGLSQSTEIIAGENRDGLLLKLDLEGNLINYSTWGNAQRNSFRDLQVNNNKIYLSGTTELDSMGITKNAFLLAFEDTPTTVSEFKPSATKSFKVYPNPANGKVNIQLDNQEHKKRTIRVIDSNGRIVWNEIKEDNEIEIELKSSGTFLINVDFGHYSVSKKIINR